MAKQLTTRSGIVFPTLKAAKDYFNKMREFIPVSTLLSEPERTDVLDVYSRYCTATNWPAEAAVDVTIEWDNQQRATGSYAQTKAFVVVTASGSTEILSMDKALAAIAT